MLLRNALLINRPDPVDVLIEGERIARVEPAGGISVEKQEHGEIDLAGALLFPGLINSHDHLDFNLFPQLGRDIYRNYTEWGNRLQKEFRHQIDPVLKVPRVLREQWGMLKNLLAGVTTVVNHGLPVKMGEGPVAVHERYHCLHSVAFEKNWRRKLNDPFRRKYPYVIHIGEGTDRAAQKEIDRLLRWNWLRKPLVGVHAVAMTAEQARAFDALVWCPGSNFFMLNRTAAIDRLKKSATILFGTDSTLTASWNIWEHIRLARNTGLLSDRELYETLNENPARVWNTGSARVEPGAVADLAVASIPRGLNRMDAFYSTGPESLGLLFRQGQLRLADDQFRSLFPSDAFDAFHPVGMSGRRKWVHFNVPRLIEESSAWLPQGAPFYFTHSFS